MKAEIKFYWRMILRRLPWMMPIIIFCTAMGFVQATRLPAVFSAEARLLVEAPQISEDLVDVQLNIDAGQVIQVIRERLLTRANLLDIANDFDVLEDYSRLPPDQIVSLMQASTQIDNRGGRNQATLITVSFEARTGQIAADVVNEYVTRIISADVERREDLAGGTLEFFEEEVARLSGELDARSARISQFQAENADAMPDDQGFRLNRQAVLQERISSAQREMSSLVDQRARIIEVYDATGQVSAGDAVLSDDQRQLRDLERELAQQLSIYSEDAPQVVTLRRRIETLRSQITTTAAPETANTPGQAVLDLQLGQLDAQIGILESVMAESEEELIRLEDAIARTPQNAIILASLQRDYESIRGQYDSAIARLAQASTGERIALTSRGQRISLIENATVPRSPSKPNRKLIAAAGAALGIGLAVGLFIVLEVLNRTIRRPVDISRAFGIEPLATVPYIFTRSERLKLITARALMLLFAFVGIPALLYAVDTYYMPLDQLASEILSRIGFS